MKNFKYCSSFILMMIISVNIYAQKINISADLRARYEMRNGYSTLKPDSASIANFISQRTRINIEYNSDKIKLKISPQNVRVWGDVNASSKNDNNTSLHEAYAEALFNKNISIQLGRQELNYDNERIFGATDWAMQGKSHDAILFKFVVDSIHKIHVGVAYNAIGESNFRQNYSIPQYKTLQYIWYHGDFKNINLSVLALNNGMPYLKNNKEKVAFTQTIGATSTYSKKKFNANVEAYVQTGKIATKKVLSYYASANLEYQWIDKLKTSIGVTYLSGKSNNDSSSTIKSFNPLYGTAHKFNGFMDYFYVGNHNNTVGLIDINASIFYKIEKFSLKFIPHVFLGAADLYKNGEKQQKLLGTELDLVAAYKVFNNFSLEAGYSQMFGTSSLELLKGGNKDNANNWVYLTAKFNPVIFKN
jgi:hypothetical protein